MKCCLTLADFNPLTGALTEIITEGVLTFCLEFVALPGKIKPSFSMWPSSSIRDEGSNHKNCFRIDIGLNIVSRILRYFMSYVEILKVGTDRLDSVCC